MTKQQIITTPSKHSAGEDRATVILSVNYHETSIGNSTAANIAYDRSRDPDESAWQIYQRVDVRKRVKVNIGPLEFGKCEILLGHDVLELPKGMEGSEVLEEAQKSNCIRITDEAGNQVALIYPKRACFAHFAGPVYAEAVSATARLSITALPV